jgi:hypothetical protein
MYLARLLSLDSDVCGRLLLDVVEVARYRPFDDRTIRRNGSCWHFCDLPTDGDDVSS